MIDRDVHGLQPERHGVRSWRSITLACAIASATMVSSSAGAATSRLARLVQTAGKVGQGKPATKQVSTPAGKAKSAVNKRNPAAEHARPPKKDAPRVAAAVLPSFTPVNSLVAEPQPELPPMMVKPVKPIPAPLPPPAEPAPTAAIAPVDDGLPDTPNDQQVLEVIRQNVPGVRACYLRLQRAGVQITGKAMVSFMVSAGGRATDLQVEAPTFSGTTLPSCVAQQIARWEFPRSHKGIATPITYPFVFVGS